KKQRGVSCTCFPHTRVGGLGKLWKTLFSRRIGERRRIQFWRSGRS
ncbi:unnamed protein product, partial [Ectocarpus sp. 13 AM-2016]